MLILLPSCSSQEHNDTEFTPLHFDVNDDINPSINHFTLQVFLHMGKLHNAVYL